MILMTVHTRVNHNVHSIYPGGHVWHIPLLSVMRKVRGMEGMRPEPKYVQGIKMRILCPLPLCTHKNRDRHKNFNNPMLGRKDI